MAKAKAQPKTVARTPKVSMTQRQVDLMKATAAKFQEKTADLKVKVAALTATNKEQAAEIRALNKQLKAGNVVNQRLGKKLGKLEAKLR